MTNHQVLKFDSIPTHQDINEDDEVIINDR